jgi:hypothetical protein
VPADKGGEGISDPTDHLLGYSLKAPRNYSLKAPRNPRFQKRSDQTVMNQFGTHQLDVLRPSWLLVPSSKDGVAQVPPLDHFQCYVIRNSKGAPKFVPRTVTVSSQIEETVTLHLDEHDRSGHHQHLDHDDDDALRLSEPCLPAVEPLPARLTGAWRPGQFAPGVASGASETEIHVVDEQHRH